MIAKKKEFFLGAGLLAAFVVVLVVLFMPLFGGKNALQYLDNLYNSISKGSAYYIPEAREQAKQFAGTAIDVTLTLGSAEQTARTAKLYAAGGAEAKASGTSLQVSGDLGKILEDQQAVPWHILAQRNGKALQENMLGRNLKRGAGFFILFHAGPVQFDPLMLPENFRD